jgi:hypothetical protein
MPTDPSDMTVLSLIRSIGEYRKCGKDEFADGIVYTIDLLGVNAISHGFSVSLEGLPFETMFDARSVIAECRRDAEGDSDDALALRKILNDMDTGQIGHATGEVFRDEQGYGIKFKFGKGGNYSQLWKTEKELTL